MAKLTITVMIIFMAAMAVTPAFSASVEGPLEVAKWFKQMETKEEKMTKLHYYFHDITGVTSEVVANANITATSPTLFGLVKVCDNPVTVGPEFSSAPVGKLQGIYSYASIQDVNFICDFTLTFTNKKYNGSTLIISGSNPPSLQHREMAVVGGTGVFRMARGLAVLSFNSFDVAKGNATVELDFLVQHY
ncbi:dirigent protein 22-like [Apium graveolens]|uniref:dirigent protein 22-like n=1 Tax=Apium graveolens TaxID=4045 RepID=UPI003D7B0E5B